MLEGIHSRGGYMGRKRKPGKCKGAGRGIQKEIYKEGQELRR